MKEQDYVDYLIECVENVEVDEGCKFLLQLTAIEGEKYVADSIISKFLLDVGEKWKTEDGFSLADTYVSAKIVRLYFEAMIEGTAKADVTKKAIIGNIKNDFQSSGRKLVIRFLEIAGWDIIDLGNDVEPMEFVRVAKENDIRFIGVSAMLYENALNIKELIQLIEENYGENKPYLIAGGAIFTVLPDLAAELSIEYTAKNVFEAKEIFEALYRR